MQEIQTKSTNLKIIKGKWATSYNCSRGKYKTYKIKMGLQGIISGSGPLESQIQLSPNLVAQRKRSSQKESRDKSHSSQFEEKIRD